MPRSAFFFTYAFPPFKAIGAIRLHAIAKGFCAHGFDVSAFGTKNVNLMPKEYFNLDGIKVKYITTLDFQTIKYFLQRYFKKSQSHNNGVTNKSTLLNYLGAFPLNAIIGEGGLIYIISIFLSTIFKIKPDDVLFSSFSPFSDHLAALFIKKLKPKVYWIADYRDLYLSNLTKNRKPLMKLNDWINNQILLNADMVTTVSEGLAQELREKAKNVIVLRNGIHDELITIALKEKTLIKNEQFTLGYTGRLYEGKREPKIIFKALGNLITNKKIHRNDILIKYAGPDGAIWLQKAKEFNLEQNCNLMGNVSLSDSIKMQNSNDINILLSWASPEEKGILTGKFYEYILAEKPILIEINGSQDPEFEKVSEKLEECQLLYGDDKYLTDTQSFIENQYLSWKNNTKNSHKNSSIDSFKWQNIMNHFFLQNKF